MYESIGRNDRDVMCGKCYSIGQSGKRIDLDSSSVHATWKGEKPWNLQRKDLKKWLPWI